jgi:hypothetical protein
MLSPTTVVQILSEAGLALPREAAANAAGGGAATDGAHVDSAAGTGTDGVLDILKIDIDGWDCLLLEELLRAGYRPSVVSIEVSGGMFIWRPCPFILGV